MRGTALALVLGHLVRLPNHISRIITVTTKPRPNEGKTLELEVKMSALPVPAELPDDQKIPVNERAKQKLQAMMNAPIVSDLVSSPPRQLISTWECGECGQINRTRPEAERCSYCNARKKPR